MVGEQQGAEMALGIPLWAGKFNIVEDLSLECAADVRLNLWEDIGNNFRNASTEMIGDGHLVHLGEPLVDADVAQIRVEEAEPDGSAVVDGLQLREALRGHGF